MQKTLQVLLYISLFLQFNSISGQIGGKYVYEFLGNPQSARLSALGGSLITIADTDITLAAANPALLSDTSHNQISINHNFAFGGVSNGYIGYARHIDKWGITSHVGITYASFGDFTAADELGNNQGTFSGGETAITIGASKQLNERITLGANLKGIFGSLESYNSTGIGADVGLLYTKPGSNFSAAFLVKNMGSEISSYGDESVSLPLDIQIGISQKLEHLPFRFTIIAHQLQQWSVRYDDPDAQDNETLFGEPVAEDSAFNDGLDNFFRHFIFNGEFLLGKKQGLKLRIGYNHLRRKELSLSTFRSLAGFSAGFGLRIKGLNIDYGLGYFHLAGASNHLSIQTNLNRFFRKF
ncbi:MAG: type IX secretion system protein PorQ [Saprospiraceae bacterium]|nr:type IX secretion system protein PorQ [Saprospiraceae bacterium]